MLCRHRSFVCGVHFHRSFACCAGRVGWVGAMGSTGIWTRTCLSGCYRISPRLPTALPTDGSARQSNQWLGAPCLHEFAARLQVVGVPQPSCSGLQAARGQVATGQGRLQTQVPGCRLQMQGCKAASASAGLQAAWAGCRLLRGKGRGPLTKGCLKNCCDGRHLALFPSKK